MISYDDILRNYLYAIFIGPEKFRFVYDMAVRAEAAAGDIAEVGVYKGGVIAALAAMFPDRTAHAFDTFSGMPETEFQSTEPHKPGDFADTSVEAVRSVFKTNNFILHPGRFPETAKNDPACDRPFAFVHADGDYYETTRDTIDWFWPRLSPGGIIVFDDWQEGGCPGVEPAIREGAAKYGYTIGFRNGGIPNDQAYIVKS